MRDLVYVKMAHSVKDYPDPDKNPISNFIKRLECSGISLQDYERKLDEAWDLIDLDLKKVSPQQVYMDSYVGAEPSYYQELADRGSRAFKAMLRLVSNGARLNKTEDTDLWLKYFNDLDKRDSFIADTIDKTLEKTGVLFMGIGHDMPAKLLRVPDINVEVIDHAQAVNDYVKNAMNEYLNRFNGPYWEKVEEFFKENFRFD